MGFFMRKCKNRWTAAFLLTVVLFLAFRYVMPLIAPFLLAFLLVYLSFPGLLWLQTKLRIRKELSMGIFMVLILALVGSALFFLVRSICLYLPKVSEGLSLAQGQVNLFFRDCCGWIERELGMDADYVERLVIERMDVFVENMQVEILPKLAEGSLGYGKKLISGIGFLGVFLISSLLFVKDFQKISDKANQSEVLSKVFEGLKKITDLVGAWIKSQLIIMAAIMLISAGGLMVFGISGGWMLGILAGFLDVLPFIGTGIVLIPTALWQLVSGRTWKFCLCLLLYGICAALREFLEPKLLGKHTGIYPVVMLFAVYAGVKLFGLSGVIKGPLYLVLWQEGYRIISEMLVGKEESAEPTD